MDGTSTGGSALGTGNSGSPSNSGVASGDSDGVGGNQASDDGLMLSSGSQTLVDLFVSDAGVLLIFSDEVRLVSRDGKTIQSVKAPREVTAAAFDGKLLVVADKAKFTTYDPSLMQLTSANLAVTCSSGVLMDNSRFVCGQNVDWDHSQPVVSRRSARSAPCPAHNDSSAWTTT